MNEEFIRARAYMIYADMQHGINPASNKTSIAWLKLALAWAIRHKRKELEKIILEYLNDGSETEKIPEFALAMNAI